MNQHSMNTSSYQNHTSALDYWNGAVSYSGQDLTIESTHTLNFNQCEAHAGSKLGCVLKSPTGATALLIVEDYPFQAHLHINLSFADVLQLDVGLRDALIEGTISHLRHELPVDFQRVSAKLPFHSVEALMSDADRAELSWFSIRYGEIGGAAACLSIGVRPEDLSSFLNGLPLTSQPVWKGLRERLTTRVCLSLCSAHLPAADVAALQAGDLVLLDTEPLGQTITVEGPHSRHHLVLVEQGWGCERIERVASMSDVNEPQPAETREVSSVDLSQMPIAVRFEIDEREITLAELESWTAGSLVNITVPALSEELTVFVRAGGQRIAQGNLVQIDNRVALRIAKLDQGTGL